MYCTESRNQQETGREEQEKQPYTVTDALKKWGVDISRNIEKGEEK